MPTPPEQSPSPETSQSGFTVALRLRIGGKNLSVDELRLLELWLEDDPELKVGVERVPSESDDGGMGLGEDLLVALALMGVEQAAFALCRSIVDHLKNRGAGEREIVISVRGVEITIRSDGRYSRRKLRQLAETIAEAVETELDAE